MTAPYQRCGAGLHSAPLSRQRSWQTPISALSRTPPLPAHCGKLAVTCNVCTVTDSPLIAHALPCPSEFLSREEKPEGRVLMQPCTHPQLLSLLLETQLHAPIPASLYSRVLPSTRASLHRSCSKADKLIDCTQTRGVQTHSSSGDMLHQVTTSLSCTLQLLTAQQQ